MNLIVLFVILFLLLLLLFFFITVLYILLLFNKFLLITESIKKHSESIRSLYRWLYRDVRESGINIDIPDQLHNINEFTEISIKIQNEIINIQDKNENIIRINDYIFQIIDLLNFLKDIKNKHNILTNKFPNKYFLKFISGVNVNSKEDSL